MQGLSHLKKNVYEAGWTTTITSFEVGSRGYASKRNFKTLTEITKKVHTPLKHQKKLAVELSQILCSLPTIIAVIRKAIKKRLSFGYCPKGALTPPPHFGHP